MSNRAFGVEIECYSPDGSYDEWGDSEDGVDETYDLLAREMHGEWAALVSQDESLYGENGGYGVEVKSPVLQGSEGINELKTVMNILSTHHYFVDKSCGLHVHVNAPEFIDEPRLIIKVVKAWQRNQHLIDNMVDVSRNGNNYCLPWRDQNIVHLEEDLKSGYGVSGTHRGAINVAALEHHGTIEIRQHEGTLDPNAAISWVQFCQAFVDEIAGGTLRKMTSEELLLKRLKVERNASRFLTTKARINKQNRERL